MEDVLDGISLASSTSDRHDNAPEQRQRSLSFDDLYSLAPVQVCSPALALPCDPSRLPPGCDSLLLGDGHLWPPGPLLTAVSGFSVRVLCCALCHVQGGFTGESKFAFVPLEGDPMTAVKRSASNDDLQALAQVPRGPHPPELCCLTVPARAHSFCQILSLVLCGRARLY